MSDLKLFSYTQHSIFLSQDSKNNYNLSKLQSKYLFCVNEHWIITTTTTRVMARTKLNVQKVMVDKPIDSKKRLVFNKIKVIQGVTCLIKMRRAKKALDMTIPNLHFQRLVRQITQEYNIVVEIRSHMFACMKLQNIFF